MRGLLRILGRDVIPVVAVLGLVAAGCSPGTGHEATTTAPQASTTAVPASSTATSLSTTQPASTTTSTSSLATTTTTTAWTAPGFPQALSPQEIPWDEVGAGWLLVRYKRAFSGEGGWDSTVPEALFLIGPENTTYAVGAWDGKEILAWSPEGRRILTFDDTLQVIDLRDGTEAVIPADLPAGDGHGIAARFTRPTGRDVVVRVVDWNDHVLLECLAVDGTLFARLADFDLPSYDDSDPEYVAVGITWLYGPSGTEIVTATSDGIRLLSNLGTVIRPLDTPGLGCTLNRWWDEGSVLAACYDRDWAASSCWYQGPTPGGRSLWSVPTDGSAATRLTPKPECTTQLPQNAPTYQDALRLGATVVAQWGGCCECGEGLDLIAAGTITAWAGYGSSPACSPGLIAVRQDRLVVLETVYSLFGVLFEVAEDGTTLRAITPIELGQLGGVLQVFTTEETVDSAD
jgi:hypothetical protein